jgi:hypothetical protein
MSTEEPLECGLEDNSGDSCALCNHSPIAAWAKFCPNCGRYSERLPDPPTFAIANAPVPSIAEICAIVETDVKTCREGILEGKKIRSILEPFDVERVRIWSVAANHGIGRGQYLLGLCLQEGWRFSIDPSGAARLFARATRTMLPDASYALGLCLRNGLGVQQNELAALRCFRDAAEACYAPAQWLWGLHLSLLDRDGEWATPTRSMGFTLIRKAARSGHKQAITVWQQASDILQVAPT